ncbi:hypothetical protein BLNAU_12025 [Blattamonas nauphoetae]|uniref:Uncharacterized protein n=1 Tax=Blattamonas nauphoetae TaxID=2049346 RepID=A0ABQ9XRI6_9EUKA|nr:hypothetical protein BLNAU_12025 [Blattamonas nauphoetae]
MTEIEKKTDPSSSTARSDLFCPPLPFSVNCSAFLNWGEEDLESEDEVSVVFRSLVTTLELQPVLDSSLERKAVRFLESVIPSGRDSADAFLISLGTLAENSSSGFVQSIVVLISSTSRVVTTAAMKILDYLIWSCSTKIGLALVRAGLIPQLVNTLNPQSLSFAEAVNIHTGLIKIINYSLWLTTQNGLAKLEIKDENKQQAVHETVFQQVLTPSEKYICHLCVNRFSIVAEDPSFDFVRLLARLLRISPYYQPTLDFVVNMPVGLAIPSCLVFFEIESSIRSFLSLLVNAQREWNTKTRQMRQMRKASLRMFGIEGFEDVTEERLPNDQERYGRRIVDDSIKWNNLQGMNLPQ